MGNVNLGWFDSREKLAGIAAEQFDLGWPRCLSSINIVVLQRPIPPDIKGAQVGFFVIGPQSNLFEAIDTTCPVERVDLVNGKTVNFHTAQAFSDWLAAQRETPSTQIQAWFDATLRAPVVMVAAGGDAAWSITKPRRYQGYTKALYDLLNKMKTDQHPHPKARDVIDAWKEKKPVEVTEVMDNEIKYLDANGNIKTADSNAIRAAISRMIKL